MRTDRDTSRRRFRFGGAVINAAQAALSLSRRAVRRPTILLAAAAVTGCGVLSTEEQLLTRFFEASRLHDTTAVARLSAVTFNPRTDGVVRAFHIVDVQRDGDLEHVTVRATVATPQGPVVDRMLRVTLQQRNGRRFITGIGSA